MSEQVRLQVMICTCGIDGLEKVQAMELPKVDGVGYVVSCQSDEQPVPEGLCRSDIQIYFTPTKGLSNNRNHAMDKVTAPYALVADDDLIFIPEALASIAGILDDNPEIDIATFRCRFPWPKVYPESCHDLDREYKNYDITSFEIAIRVGSIRRAGLRFSPLMGIGAPLLHAGEENVFVLSALRSGMKGRFFPVTVCSHPSETTGLRHQSKPGVLRAAGAFICYKYNFLNALPRYVLKAWRSKGFTPRNLRFVLSGAFYWRRHSKEILNTHD